MLGFGVFALDVDGRRLLRDGDPVPLEPQAFDVLAYLVEHRDVAVSKEQLLDAVWGDRWVSESALTTRIKEIRRAVDDTGQAQAVIRTVRGHGYQFVAPVDGSGKPAHSSAAPAGTVALIGRDRDVLQLDQRLTPGALVTVVGPGGVGKTTLGRSLASVVEGRFRDGFSAVDLTVVRDRDELYAVVARAMQIVDSSAETLPTLLGSLDAVLLLDDADELVPEVADLCTAIVSGTPKVALLVTCRERLGSPGEQVWPLLPLTEDAAVQLLKTRAEQLAPLGSLVAAPDDELAALVRLVDNLPLAIEMVASASAHLGRADLAELVASAPQTLTDPRRNAPARHRSLETLVDASIERLDDASVEALMAASTFAGAFRLADAAAVTGLGPAGLEVLRGLVDRSLLAPSVPDAQGPRFQMLRTVTRAVRRRAGSGELDRHRAKHAAWLADELRRTDEQLRGQAERTAADRFAALSDDARVAHAWAREHDVTVALDLTSSLHLYAYSRLWAEPAEWAESIPGWRDHGRALVAAASQASQEARFDDGESLARLALNDDDPRVRGWALEALSDVEIYRGDLQDAIEHADQLVALGLEHAHPRMLALGTTNAVLARAYTGDTAAALALWEGYPWSGPRSQSPTDQAWLELSYGESLAIAGRTDPTGALLERAIEHLERAVELGGAADSRFVTVAARADLGSVQQGGRDLASAAETYHDLIATYYRHGIITHLTITLRNTAPLLVSLGRDREAAVIAGWLLAQDVRSGYGPDPIMVREASVDVRTRHPDDAEGWELAGAAMTAFQVADLTLLALKESSGPDSHAV